MNFESRETRTDSKLLKGKEANAQRASAVTPELFEAFLRQNPPRHVPRAIYRKATADSLLFIMLLGFIFFAQGLAMAWIFFPRRLPDDARISARGTVGTGVVLQVHTTRMNENNRRVVRYVFEFRGPDGSQRTGTCYSSTTRYEQGAFVEVEYLPDDSSVARLRGCRLSVFGWGAAIVALLPAAGFFMMAFAARSRLRIRHLLTHGQFALGRATRIKELPIQVNKQTVWQVTIAFQVAGRVHEFNYRVRGDSKVESLRKKVEAAATVGLLYDPANPARALLVDDWLKIG